MDRLAAITFRLPSSPEARRFLESLRELLADVAYASADAAGALVLSPPSPADARPVTTVQTADVPAPEVVLDIGRTIGVAGGGPDPHRARLDLAELAHRLAGSVRRVDHTGVNLPARAVAVEQWESLVRDIAGSTTMYRYPTGEPWPFVLPSTAVECETGISDFVVGREPRFELVHDSWNPCTTWQFALWTTLTRTELERLFPAPDGIALPGLEDVFRTVHVRHPWPDLEIRFDLCYRIEDGPSDWETGEWLVTHGGRIR